MSIWSRKPFVALRLLGRHGHYPDFDFRSPSHVFVAEDDLVWSAVLQPPLPQEWELGETVVLVPEEVRLFAAITLSESDPWNNGMPVITHWNQSHLAVDGSEVDLSTPEHFDRVRAAIAALGPASADSGPESTHGYRISDVGSIDDAAQLLANIDSNDQLLLAGLARLLGANRLLAVANEPEEAAIALFISMGAALEFIRLSLIKEDGEDVPFAKVSEYFRETFSYGEDLVEYFEARNEERVIAIHPANRFGEFWAPPLMMSDVYHLRKTIMQIYRHILLGEIPV
jgi:hypothetical protein